MIQTPQKILWQKQVTQELLFKIVDQSILQNEPQETLIILKQGDMIFQGHIPHIKILGDKENSQTTAKQLMQILENKQTLVEFTEKKAIVITCNEKMIWLVLQKEQGKQAIKQVGVNLFEEKLHKLELFVGQQQKKYEQFTKKTENAMQSQTQKINQLSLQLESTKEQLQTVKLSLSTQHSELLSLKQTIQPLIIQQQDFSCFHHPYNPHSHHFTLRLNPPNRLKIIKASDNTFHNFISNLPIPQGKTAQFRIKQVRVIDGQVYIGVGTKSVFGDINSWNRDFLSYYSGDGDICENGLYHEGGEQIRDGQIVTLRVDLSSQRVSWWLQNKLLAETVLPQQMQKKHLYLVLLMKHKGDELDLLLDEPSQ